MTTEVCPHDRLRRLCDECDMTKEKNFGLSHVFVPLTDDLDPEIASGGRRVARNTSTLERLKSDRRERNARAALTGLLANPTRSGTMAQHAADAVDAADALIAKLDKEPTR